MPRRYHQPDASGKPATLICLDCRRAKRPHCVLCAAEGVL